MGLLASPEMAWGGARLMFLLLSCKWLRGLLSRRKERRGPRGAAAFLPDMSRCRAFRAHSSGSTSRGSAGTSCQGRLLETLTPLVWTPRTLVVCNGHRLWKFAGTFPASVCWGSITFRIWEGHIWFPWNTGEADVSIRYVRKGWSVLWLICDHLTLYFSCKNWTPFPKSP